VNLVAQQVGSGTLSGPAQTEVQGLITTGGQLANDLTQLAGQGLGSDATFQQDLASLITIEGQLAGLITPTSGTGSGSGSSSGSSASLLLQEVTTLISAEGQLVNLVAQQVGSASIPAFAQPGIQGLLTIEAQLANDLMMMAGQGLGTDSTFQMDLANLVTSEVNLSNLVSQAFGAGSGSNL
jgi:hypothetical protein